MSISLANLITAAQKIAQDPAASGTALLRNLALDYDAIVLKALETFRLDRPNERVYHATITAAGFRLVLSGAGVVLPSSGLDAWTDGVAGSRLTAVYLDYDTATQGNVPLDPNVWRVLREPSLVLLELLADSVAIAQVVRFEYTSPHVVGSSVGATSVRAADVAALEILTAAEICQATARRYVQNTGVSGFEADSVDRRTQSDVMASRAKDLMAAYGAIVGKGASTETAPAGLVRRLTVRTSFGGGRLWPH